MLFRLNGDFNPLHADPAVAQSVGYCVPILHGLCTRGVSVRHVLQRFAENDGARMAGLSVRYIPTASAFPPPRLYVLIAVR